MGITTPISTNPAMTIGGPDRRRHAAGHGPRLRDDRPRRASASAARWPKTTRPVGIQEVEAARSPAARRRAARRQPWSRRKRVLPAEVAATETSMLETVLQYGTAKAAAIGEFAAGKTGTTSNYGDAWFVGWDSQVHGRRVGRLPEQADPDDHRLRRRPRARRHLPGADLARLHDLRAADRKGTRQNKPPRAAEQARQEGEHQRCRNSSTGSPETATPSSTPSPNPTTSSGKEAGRKAESRPRPGDGGESGPTPEQRSRKRPPNRNTPPRRHLRRPPRKPQVLRPPPRRPAGAPPRPRRRAASARGLAVRSL